MTLVLKVLILFYSCCVIGSTDVVHYKKAPAPTGYCRSLKGITSASLLQCLVQKELLNVAYKSNLCYPLVPEKRCQRTTLGYESWMIEPNRRLERMKTTSTTLQTTIATTKKKGIRKYKKGSKHYTPAYCFITWNQHGNPLSHCYIRGKWVKGRKCQKARKSNMPKVRIFLIGIVGSLVHQYLYLLPEMIRIKMPIICENVTDTYFSFQDNRIFWMKRKEGREYDELSARDFSIGPLINNRMDRASIKLGPEKLIRKWHTKTSVAKFAIHETLPTKVFLTEDHLYTEERGGRLNEKEVINGKPLDLVIDKPRNLIYWSSKQDTSLFVIEKVEIKRGIKREVHRSNSEIKHFTINEKGDTIYVCNPVLRALIIVGEKSAPLTSSICRYVQVVGGYIYFIHENFELHIIDATTKSKIVSLKYPGMKKYFMAEWSFQVGPNDIEPVKEKTNKNQKGKPPDPFPCLETWQRYQRFDINFCFVDGHWVQVNAECGKGINNDAKEKLPKVMIYITGNVQRNQEVNQYLLYIPEMVLVRLPRLCGYVSDIHYEHEESRLYWLKTKSDRLFGWLKSRSFDNGKLIDNKVDPDDIEFGDEQQNQDWYDLDFVSKFQIAGKGTEPFVFLARSNLYVNRYLYLEKDTKIGGSPLDLHLDKTQQVMYWSYKSGERYMISRKKYDDMRGRPKKVVYTTSNKIVHFTVDPTATKLFICESHLFRYDIKSKKKTKYAGSCLYIAAQDGHLFALGMDNILRIFDEASKRRRANIEMPYFRDRKLAKFVLDISSRAS